MPQDLLQIALEHHRAGRLRQAEAGYRALLDASPDDADARIGSACCSSRPGRAEQALPCSERAAALRPGRPGLPPQPRPGLSEPRPDGRRDRSASSGRPSLGPGRAETLVGLGLARLARQAAGDADGGRRRLRQAHAAGLDSADLHHDLGVALLAAGRTGRGGRRRSVPHWRGTADYASALLPPGVGLPPQGRAAGGAQVPAQGAGGRAGLGAGVARPGDAGRRGGEPRRGGGAVPQGDRGEVRLRRGLAWGWGGRWGRLGRREEAAAAAFARRPDRAGRAAAVRPGAGEAGAAGPAGPPRRPGGTRSRRWSGSSTRRRRWTCTSRWPPG